MITDSPVSHPYSSVFDGFVASINARLQAASGPLFETDASGLWEAYLDSVADPVERQRRSCSCCRKFIERFGALATVNDLGAVVSALWDAEQAPAEYRAGAAAMAQRVASASIDKPFLSGSDMYGTPEKGNWTHFAVKPTAVYAGNGLVNAFQAACAKREEFDSVRRALGEYPRAVCETALRLLAADNLANSEAALGQAQFLVDLHAARDAVHGQRHKDNLVRRMVAQAPAGFCHPRSSMIATLLDDIAAGKSFDEAAAGWAAKMHPLRYLRPQAAPTEGAIKAAEEAFEKLGAGTALQRRFATMADILETEWTPRADPGAAPAASAGLFASVKAKVVSPMTSMRAPVVTMTVEKFRRTVLPTAEKIGLAVPRGRTSMVALTTAVHADARPIIQWDRAEARNPVAWYVYNGGSLPKDFNITTPFADVIAITLGPHAWGGQVYAHQGERLCLILKDCRDLREGGGGNALFPVFLKNEYHAFRSTIEAYSKINPLTGFGEDNVAGLVLAKGETHDITLRVTAAGQVSDYRIDRWD